MRLWSMEETMGMTTLPSVKERTETSGPVRNSSMTMWLPLSPKTLSSMQARTASSASCRVMATVTPLAQGQAVGLDHGGDGGGFQVLQGLVHVVKGLVLGRRNVVFLHEVLGKDLAPLQDGGRLVGAEAGDAHGLQPVHRPQDQGSSGATTAKSMALSWAKGGDGVQVLGANAGANGVGGHAAVAGGSIDLGDPGALFQGS